ncbi:uncharacterized protein LOC135155296 [Lytechinus pictus]|uniref:uncharacterized protein LOC135155296 n=1 Tax=Lytechinus pictus TaxID=7653 RepID=UPI0030BA2AB0
MRKRDSKSRLLIFTYPRIGEDDIWNLAFSSSHTREVEKTRFGISLSHLHIPEKSRRRDLESRFLIFSYPRSREEEIWNLAFSSSHTREVGKTRFGISLYRLLVSENFHCIFFLSSLHYEGVWEQVHIESNSEGQGGETLFRDPAILTNQVITFDTRGLSDLGTTKVSDVMDEITGKRGINPRSWTTGERIDCPIFILKYNSDTGIDHFRDFLSSLVPQIRQEFGSYPIMVVTFAKSILNQDEIIGEITRAGMEKNGVFFTENYTASNHEMDSKKHIALLKILEACIKRADDNITFRWRKDNEPKPKSTLSQQVESTFV